VGNFCLIWGLTAGHQWLTSIILATQEDQGSNPAQANSLQDPMSKKSITKSALSSNPSTAKKKKKYIYIYIYIYLPCCPDWSQIPRFKWSSCFSFSSSWDYRCPQLCSAISPEFPLVHFRVLSVLLVPYLTLIWNNSGLELYLRFLTWGPLCSFTCNPMDSLPPAWLGALESSVPYQATRY
jgi:hypothetical protein